jgi:DHA2 family multidrug resistance protein-like MFS transporter
VRIFRPVNVLSAGLLLATCGFLLLTQLDAGNPLPVLMTSILLMCLGLSPAGTLTTDLVMRLAPPERAGAASAISETSFEFGGAFGIALLGSMVAASYRLSMAGLNISEVPESVLTPARRTLDAAVIAAGKLPAALSEQLLDAAHGAFSGALDRAALICVAATLFGFVIARLRLSRV